jgi:polyisoprenoid-binding protein YceI
VTTNPRDMAGAVPAGVYRIDPQRSTVAFTTRHMFGLAPVRGTFTLLDGEIRIGDPVGESTARATIDAASFTTDNPKRDSDVKSPKLLDVAQYPTISFVGDLTREDADGYRHSGALTAHGVTQPVEVTIDAVTETIPEINLKASVRIDRYAFGVTKVKGMAGRHLDLHLDVTALRT